MNRGFFSQLAQTPTYQSAKKSWHVTLCTAKCFWYELVVNSPEFQNTKANISVYLDKFRAEADATLKKRFIYFFTSRPRIRFDLRSPPRYSFFGNSIKISFLVGSKHKRVARNLKFLAIDGVPVKPKLSLIDDRFIRISNDDDSGSMTYSVHDFIKWRRIRFGYATEVHYVGITKDPGGRPLDRQHRGICDTLYNYPTSERDFFIEVGLFKATSDATSQDGAFRFVIANSMLDEISTEDEGRVIESALILYFDTKSQEVDRKNSTGVLRNRLKKMKDTNNIGSISFHLEAEDSTEYDILFSRSIEPALGHSFLWKLDGDNPILSKFDSEEELREFVENEGNS